MRGFEFIEDNHTEDVWCPETEFGTWIAVDEEDNEFITGNSVSSPNFQQLNNSSPIRECFTIDDGYMMLDTDLASAELVLQANALYQFDGGVFGRVLEEGDKDKGTDFHSLNGKALTIKRGQAKQVFYGISYGMGNTLLGFTMWKADCTKIVTNYYSPYEIDLEWNKLKRKREKIKGIWYYPITYKFKIPISLELVYMSLYGKMLKTNIQKNIKGLEELNNYLDNQVKDTKGYVITMDGRYIYAKETSSKLNYLLQPNNAQYTKYWVYYSMSIAFKLGYRVPDDFLPLAVIHDQLVWQVKTKHISVFKKIVAKATTLINRKFNLKFGIECDTEIVKNLTGH